MQAFSLEESGAYAEAERAGRAAVERNPADLWAVHAVAHVMEMQDRRREGIAWIRESEPQLGDCNNFGYHVWWHLALFHLELDGWSRSFGSTTSGCARTFPTSTSTSATRLRCCGAWKSAASTWAIAGTSWRSGARPRTADHQMVFPDVHYMLAIAAGGRDGAVERMLDSMTAFAEGTATEQAVMRSAGIPIGKAIAHWYRGEYAEVVDVLAPVRYRLPLIGGSHAQRDLFQQVLVAAALAAGRHETARTLLSERAARKRGTRGRGSATPRRWPP